MTKHWLRFWVSSVASGSLFGSGLALLMLGATISGIVQIIISLVLITLTIMTPPIEETKK